MRAAAGATLAASLLVLAAGGPGAARPGAPAPPPSPPAVVDRDRDRIYDDLEMRLGGLDPGARLAVIVRLAGPPTAGRIDALRRAAGDLAPARRFRIIDGLATTLTAGQIRSLANHSEVTSIEFDAPVQTLNLSGQEAFGVAAARLDAPGLDGDADGVPGVYSSRDLVAAVIDTGIDAGHRDLDDGKVLAFHDLVNGRTAPYDDNGHGTHVAATVAGDGEGGPDGRGVAPGAGLVGVKVLDAQGGGNLQDVIAGIEWVVENRAAHGIEVINLSLGASGCADGTDATSQAVERATAAGLVVVVAAGNEGPGTCTVGTPAAAPGALTVGAMSDTAVGGFALAPFSSRGPTADGRVKPDVVGPGVAVRSAQAGTATGYVTMDGTSMATPFVAGLALLMREVNPGLTPADIKDAMRSTAVDWARGGDNRTAGTTGADVDYGAGRLDGHAALRAAGAQLGTTPAAVPHLMRSGTLGGTGAAEDHAVQVTDTRVPIAATLLHPGVPGAAASSPDFDLYLYDASGAVVARAETDARQEVLSHRPAATGSYRLRVRSYAGSGAYVLDVSAGVGVDTVAPNVASVSPADGAVDVAVGTSVSMTFSEAMDRAATQAAVSLVREADAAPVTVTATWTDRTLVLDPAGDLAGSTTYRVRVGTGARDVAGNALAAERTSAFTTAPVPVSAALYPDAAVIVAGTPRAGDVTRLRADDNAFFEVNSSTAYTRVADWYGRIGGVPNSLRSLRVAYRGRSTRTCAQTLSVLRWTDSRWVTVDSRSVGTTKVGVDVAPGGVLADYVSGTSGTGEMRVRIRCATTAGTFVLGGDLLRITTT